MVVRGFELSGFFGEEWEQAREVLMTLESFSPENEFVHDLSLGGDLFYDPRTSFPMEETGDLGKILEGSKDGYFYTRAGSPQERALRDRLLFAEAGYLFSQSSARSPRYYVDATVFPTGMAAIYGVAMALARNTFSRDREYKDAIDKGLHFMRGKTVFVNTKNVLDETVPQETGIEKAIAVDTINLAEVYKALQEHGRKTIALFYEGVTNPLIQPTNTREVARMAHEQGIPVIVDNTFLTPYLQQPFRMGADIVIHSITKYVSGEGDLLGGAVIGPKDFIRHLRAWQTVSGSVMDPSVAAEFYKRLKSLPDRMKIHTQYARDVAQFLNTSPRVDKVYYPNLGEQSRGGSPGGVVTFELAGAAPEEKFAREKALMEYAVAKEHFPVAYEVSLGTESHLMMGESTLGIDSDYAPGTVRLSVGRHPSADAVITFLKKAFEEIYRTESM